MGNHRRISVGTKNAAIASHALPFFGTKKGLPHREALLFAFTLVIHSIFLPEIFLLQPCVPQQQIHLLPAQVRQATDTSVQYG